MILQEVRDVVHVSVNDHPAIIPAVVLADFVKADEFLATGLLGSRQMINFGRQRLIVQKKPAVRICQCLFRSV